MEKMEIAMTLELEKHLFLIRSAAYGLNLTIDMVSQVPAPNLVDYRAAALMATALLVQVLWALE
jgi:hypothetical protein